VEENQSGLSDSPPENLNGDDNEMDKHQQVDMVEDCEVTVDDNEQQNKIEQIGEAEYVEETVVERVKSVTEQENEFEQMGEAEYVEETVVERVECINEQEKEIEPIDEDKAVEETVLAHVEGLQGENSCAEAGDTVASRCV
jgi:hypothetical protein